jgi:hypothetical protein
VALPNFKQGALLFVVTFSFGGVHAFLAMSEWDRFKMLGYIISIIALVFVLQVSEEKLI